MSTPRDADAPITAGTADTSAVPDAFAVPDTSGAISVPVRAARWTLRGRLATTFGILGTLVAVLVAAAIVSTVVFVHAGNAVIYRWQPVLLNAESLTTDLVDQETGMRGYALSRDPAFLQPYRQAVASQAAHVERLRSLIGGDGAVHDRLDTLLAAARRWQHDYALPVVQGTVADPGRARALATSPGAKRAFDAIRAQAAGLYSQASRRTATARADRTAAGVVFIVALSLAALTALGGGLTLWRGLRRWVIGPIQVLGEQTRAVAGGDTHREIHPVGAVEFTDLGRDVEAMRRRIAEQLSRAETIQEELRRQGAELERSNEDLQQFAYVASHDLSEPLRKVANFCQLLERQYAGQLDDRARQYIDFAVDGAKRMQTLIGDLLALSRVGRATETFVAVPLAAVVTQAERTLAERIADSGARVVVDGELPTVSGDRTLLASLMENLIGNAVKYRRDDVAPEIRISAERDGAVWRVRVVDNGIGIDPQYAERIFVVFQRLHVRDKYEGTGIGLALCRRIVEFHGGHIRLVPVESGSHGATFEFTLPEGGSAGAQSRD